MLQTSEVICPLWARSGPSPQPILRNRLRLVVPVSHPVRGFKADPQTAQDVEPFRLVKYSRKHHAQPLVARMCASAFPWACRLRRSKSPAPIQAAAGSCQPADRLGHRPFPAGTDRPACDSADRRRLNRRRELPHAARILAPDRGTMPAARPSCSPSIPDRRGIPSSAIRRRCCGFDS